MVLGYPIHEILFIWLGIIFVTGIVSLLPFAVQRFRPQIYRGWWKIAREFLKSPKRVLAHTFGSVIGLLLVAFFFCGREITDDNVQLLWFIVLPSIIILLVITIGIRLHSHE